MKKLLEKKKDKDMGSSESCRGCRYEENSLVCGSCTTEKSLYEPKIASVIREEKRVLGIEISDAEKLSVKTGFDEIMILGIDPLTGDQHVTTFGRTKTQSVDAADIGNWLKRLLGWPEEDCHLKPTQTILDKKEDS